MSHSLNISKTETQRHVQRERFAKEIQIRMYEISKVGNKSTGPLYEVYQSLPQTIASSRKQAKIFLSESSLHSFSVRPHQSPLECPQYK